jgi:coproporphyrinogen III oxidase-like Fe-S oxidoreductase
LVRGVDLKTLAARYGSGAIPTDVIDECVSDGLLEFADDVDAAHTDAADSGARRRIVRLTARGRLLSNEVFQRFISVAAAK